MRPFPGGGTGLRHHLPRNDDRTEEALLAKVDSTPESSSTMETVLDFGLVFFLSLCQLEQGSRADLELGRRAHVGAGVGSAARKGQGHHQRKILGASNRPDGVDSLIVLIRFPFTGTGCSFLVPILVHSILSSETLKAVFGDDLGIARGERNEFPTGKEDIVFVCLFVCFPATQSFNKEFDELSNTHRGFSVPDIELRESVKRDNKVKPQCPTCSDRLKTTKRYRNTVEPPDQTSETNPVQARKLNTKDNPTLLRSKEHIENPKEPKGTNKNQ